MSFFEARFVFGPGGARGLQGLGDALSDLVPLNELQISSAVIGIGRGTYPSPLGNSLHVLMQSHGDAPWPWMTEDDRLGAAIRTQFGDQVLVVLDGLVEFDTTPASFRPTMAAAGGGDHSARFRVATFSAPAPLGAGFVGLFRRSRVRNRFVQDPPCSAETCRQQIQHVAGCPVAIAAAAEAARTSPESSSSANPSRNPSLTTGDGFVLAETIDPAPGHLGPLPTHHQSGPAGDAARRVLGRESHERVGLAWHPRLAIGRGVLDEPSSDRDGPDEISDG